MHTPFTKHTHVYRTGVLQPPYAVVTRPEMLQVQRAPKQVKTQAQILGAFATRPAGHPSLLSLLLDSSLPARSLT